MEFLPHYFAVGVVGGFFAGLLGIGGGVVVSPLLLEVFMRRGMDESAIVHLAIGTTLSVVACVAVFSFVTHARQGSVRWPLARALVFGTLPGAMGGALFAGLLLPGMTLKAGLAAFLFLNGGRMLIPPSRRGAQKPLPSRGGLAAVGGMFAFVSAVLGTGGGIFTVPYLARRGVPMHNAVGTSAFLGFPLALTACIGYIISGRVSGAGGALGFVDGRAFLAVAAAGAVGAVLGAKMSARLPREVLRKIFGVTLVLLGTRLALSLAGVA